MDRFIKATVKTPAIGAADFDNKDVKITPEIFVDVILPICYGTHESDKSLWRIDNAEASRLHETVAGSRDFAMGPSNKSLTYGEVIPTSIERDVLPALGLPDDIFREIHKFPTGSASPGVSSPRSTRSPRVSSAAEELETPRSTSRTKSVIAQAMIAQYNKNFTNFEPGNVFYDLGSGTGKIPLQVALRCPDVVCKGIEYAEDRHREAIAAYSKLSMPVVELQILCKQQLEKSGHSTAYAASIARQMHNAGKRLSAIHGDFTTVDISDATLIFINNTVFEPALMIRLHEQLARLPNLRRLTVIRALCARHSLRCVANAQPCRAFVHPPVETTCNPTWCPTVSLFTYATVASLGVRPPDQLPITAFLEREPPSSKRKRATPRTAAGGIVDPTIDLPARVLFADVPADSPRKRARVERPTDKVAQRSPTAMEGSETLVKQSNVLFSGAADTSDDIAEVTVGDHTSPVDSTRLHVLPEATPHHTPPRAPPRTPSRPATGSRAPSVHPSGPAADAAANMTTMTDAQFAQLMAEAHPKAEHVPVEPVQKPFMSPARPPRHPDISNQLMHATPAKQRTPSAQGTPYHRMTAEVLGKSPSTVRTVRGGGVVIPVTPARGTLQAAAYTPAPSKPAPTAPDSPFYTTRRTPKHPSTVDILAVSESESDLSEAEKTARTRLGKRLQDLPDELPH